ncbi:hypothetical protein DTO212C5_793 [Paecilomyces variotii]|nr:hypothetical protein DTO212C5_793 [Paecilomyces variotii]
MMNQKKFLEQYTYALEHEFTSPAGVPASWAPGHPKKWGQEKAAIRLSQKLECTPALSPDDLLLAIGVGEDIHVYKVATQERLQVLKGHSEMVKTVQFSSVMYDSANYVDGCYLLVSDSHDLSGEESPEVILWELDKHGKLLSSRMEASENTAGNLRFKGELGDYGSPAFSPDGKTMIFLSQNQTTQNDEDEGGEPREASLLPCVNIWSIESRSMQHRLLGHTDSIQWTGISPDNLRAASIAWDGTARIWDIISGACLHMLGPFGGQLWCGAFSPDGEYLAISQGNPKCQVHIYEISTERAVSSFDFHRMARSIAWSIDGAAIACGADKGTLAIWDPYTGQEQMRWSLAFEDPMMGFLAVVRGVRFLNRRKLIFQISEGTVNVYDFETNLKQQFTRRAQDKIEKFPRAEMVASERLAIVPDSDGTIRFWDL